MVTIPLTLNTLPIIRSLDVLPLDGSFCLVAETGTGKTMIIPVMIHIQTGRKVILRQPTRAAASQVYKALNKFWGQQVDIGIHTSDMSIGGVKECDIMVCTDGVMRHWLRDMEFEATIVFDEAHQLQAPTEIEMGVVKTRIREGRLLDMVILSATIRPSNILKWLEDLSPNPATPEEIERVCTMLETHGDEVNTTYQPQWMKLFYAEGVPYEISDRVWNWDGREETKRHPGPVLQWCNEVKRGRERGLAFLTTRKEVEMMASLVADQIPGLQTDFVHADRDIDKIIKMAWEAENLNEPLVLFSTPVLGTSVTIPFGHVLVRDRGLAERFEYGVKKTDVNLPRDSNSIIQMRGRCGRLRPGIFTLVSSFRSGMQDVKPCPVEPPLENQSPNELVIICGQYGVDPNYLDVLSDVLVDDVRHAVNRLKWWGIVREDEDYLDFLELVAPPGDDRDSSMMPGELTLTKFGWSVSVLPLEIERAVMVRRAPRDILPIIIAIAATPDIFRMFKHEVTVVGGNRVPGHDMLDPNLKHPDSSLLTKAKILQAAVRARADPNYTLPLFAEDNGLWKRTLEYSLNNYYRICAAMRRSERRMREEFRDMDIDSLGSACMAYLCSLNIFELAILSRHMHMHTIRYWGDYDVNNGKMLNCSLDGAELAVIDPRNSRRLRVMGTPKVLTSSGRDFVKWSDTIVVKRG